MNFSLKKNRQASLASFSAAFAVVFLALAAHALKSRLDPDKVSAITTAGQIQLFHAIAMIAMFSSGPEMQANLRLAGKMLFAGSLIFSLSIYLLATIPLTGLDYLHFLGPVTPIGGVLMICGWVIAGLKYLK
ncbi:MAG: DUF423 domain-containing protein [Bacteroidetes bacterium]|nr:DUF423 domain-containing protein [Bacteroidota bacterium]